MNVEEKRQLLLAQLDQSLKDLDKAAKAMAYSKQKAIAIGEKDGYNLEEQEVFEALTARFARASDIFTQRALRTLFALLQENPQTKIDAANLAEKMGIVADANTLLNVRELRNQIAHEYVRSDLIGFFMEVLHYVPELEKIIESLNNYCKRFDNSFINSPNNRMK